MVTFDFVSDALGEDEVVRGVGFEAQDGAVEAGGAAVGEVGVCVRGD